MHTEDTATLSDWLEVHGYPPIRGGAEDEPGEDQTDAPDDAAPAGEPSAEESFADSFNPDELSDELQPAYKQMQGDYTRKTQELSQQRQEAEQAQALVQALQDPDYQAQALQWLGLELADEEDPAGEQDEELLPEEKLAQRLDSLESQLFERDQHAELQSLQDAEDEHILGEVERLAEQHGEFTDQELQLLYTHSLANRKADGEPDVTAAYEALAAAEEAARERYVNTKRAHKIGVGTAGTKKIDLNDDDARQALMTDIMNAEAGEVT